MPDASKIEFKKHTPRDLAEFLGNVTEMEVDILKKMLSYSGRQTAEELLRHEYFLNAKTSVKLNELQTVKKKSLHADFVDLISPE